MPNLKVIIERTDDGLWASIPDMLGCVSFGTDFIDLKQNLNDAVELHIEGLKEDGEPIPKFQKFEFRLDMSYFFKTFPISISGIAKHSGINRSLLNQYASGLKTPSLKQATKVQNSVRYIGEAMSRISFI